MNTASNFVAAFKDLQADAHRTMQEKGWWDSRRKLETAAAHHSPELCEFAKVTNQLSMLMLMVTEIAECAEGLRHGNPPDDKIPNFTAAEAELADVILRIMDKAEAYGWDVAGAIIAKAEMNKGRAHMHGGKKA
jgi:NTP pyrophosphatase (non-canonical NTP hydrolase)